MGGLDDTDSIGKHSGDTVAILKKGKKKRVAGGGLGLPGGR